MLKTHALLCTLLLGSMACEATHARMWTDSTGKYTVQAELIDFDAKTVVMKRMPEGVLISVPIDRLGEADRKYLKSKEQLQSQQAGPDGSRIWTLRDGEQVTGRLIQYARATARLQRRRGKVYITIIPQRFRPKSEVIDKPIDEITELHQYLLPKVVSHFEEDGSIRTLKDIKAWAMKLKGQPRDYLFEGVVLVLRNGEKFAVPFFLFSEDDLKVLGPGWEEFVAAEKSSRRFRKTSKQATPFQSSDPSINGK